jgi:hypothetical protein
MLSILAVILLVAVAAQAAEVKSANVAGVINVAVEAGQYALVGVQLDDMDTASPTIGDVLGTEGVPDGTKVLLLDGLTYVDHIYYDGFGWYQGADPSTAVVDRVTGFWIKCPVAHTFAITGEVPDYSTPVTLDSGYQILTYPFPAEKALADTDIGANAVDGDKILVLEGGSYVDHIYYDGFGWYQGADPSDLVFSYGQSFWYKRAGGTVSFDESVPYTLD